MTLKNFHVKILVVALFLSLFSGCGGLAVKKPGIISTLKSQVMLNYSGYSDKFKKKALIAIKAPDKIRFEIKGFWNEPLFVFIYKNKNIKIFSTGDNVYYEGNVFESNSNLVELFLVKTNNIKIERNKTMVIVNFSNYKTLDDISIPLKIEVIFSESKVVFNYLEPSINIEIPDKTFDFNIPKSARKLTEEEIDDLLKKCIQ